MYKLKKISLIVLILFYLVAGANHFRDPSSYFNLIPHYFHYPVIINLAAGFCEVAFAVLLIFSQTRRLAAWGIILMLIAFLPVHVQMIGDAPLFWKLKDNAIISLDKVADSTAIACIVGMVVY